MIVSTKGRYALRVMIDLAEHQSEKYVPLKEVAARQEISEKYLENILKVLVQNGFLEGLRGKGGGYRADPQPGSVHGKRDLDAYRRQSCPGKLPDPRRFCLRPDGQLPHLRDVEGAQRSDLGLLRQDHTGRPCPAGSGRQRLCDLNLAHRNCTGAFFCTVLRKRCRTSWQDLRLMERAVRGILLLCVRQKIPGKKPVVCSL